MFRQLYNISQPAITAVHIQCALLFQKVCERICCLRSSPGKRNLWLSTDFDDKPVTDMPLTSGAGRLYPCSTE